MLCFDVKIDKEAQAYADEVGVKIFSAEIIYHLFDNFTAYQKVGSFVLNLVHRLITILRSKFWNHNDKRLLLRRYFPASLILLPFS
jgi:hypothetical protein